MLLKETDQHEAALAPSADHGATAGNNALVHNAGLPKRERAITNEGESKSLRLSLAEQQIGLPRRDRNHEGPSKQLEISANLHASLLAERRARPLVRVHVS